MFLSSSTGPRPTTVYSTFGIDRAFHGVVKSTFLTAVAGLVVGCAYCAEPSPRDLVARSITNYEKDWQAALDFTYIERDITKDSSDRAKTVEISQVNVFDGTPYSRLIAKDKVTSFIRAPFTRFQESSGQGEVEEQPCGHGLRFAVGELLVCPYCLAQWVASGLAIGLIGAPRPTRLVSSVLVAHTVSDFLQVAYRAAEDRL